MHFVACQKHELPLVQAAFNTYFFILFGYFLVIPLREETALALGAHQLPALFAGSLAFTVLAAPTAAALLQQAPRLQRQAAYRTMYRLLAAALLAFYAASGLAARWQPPPESPAAAAAAPQLRALAESGVGSTTPPAAAAHPSLQGPPLSLPQRALGACFYIWLSCQILICTSSFWSLCADVFPAELAPVAYGFIAAGGTLGQLAGSFIAGLYYSSRYGGGGSSNQGTTAQQISLKESEVASSHTELVGGARHMPPTADDAAAAASTHHALLLAASAALVVASFLVGGIKPPGGSQESDSARRGGSSSSGTTGADADAAAGSGDAARNSELKRSTPSRTISVQAFGSLGGLAGDQKAHARRLSYPSAEAAAVATATISGAGGSAVSLELPSGSGRSGRGGSMLVSALQSAVTSVLLIKRSRYLLTISAFLIFAYMTASLLYFLRAVVVASALAAGSQRSSFFAWVNTASAAVISVLQLSATGRLIACLGVPAVVCAPPIVSLAGFALISARPTPLVVAGVEVLRKVVQYVLGRPCREVLFTVVPPAEKYGAKMLVDVVMQRGGDALAAGVFGIIDSGLHWGLLPVSLVAAALSGAWLLIALQLGAMYAVRLAASRKLPAA